jgi:hypothetical protein
MYIYIFIYVCVCVCVCVCVYLLMVVGPGYHSLLVTRLVVDGLMFEFL